MPSPPKVRRSSKPGKSASLVPDDFDGKLRGDSMPVVPAFVTKLGRGFVPMQAFVGYLIEEMFAPKTLPAEDAPKTSKLLDVFTLDRYKPDYDKRKFLHPEFGSCFMLQKFWGRKNKFIGPSIKFGVQNFRPPKILGLILAMRDRFKGRVPPNRHEISMPFVPVDAPAELDENTFDTKLSAPEPRVPILTHFHAQDDGARVRDVFETPDLRERKEHGHKKSREDVESREYEKPEERYHKIKNHRKHDHKEKEKYSEERSSEYPKPDRYEKEKESR